MSCFELIGGILNIKEIIAGILRHVADHLAIREVLEVAAERASRIQKNVEIMQPLEALYSSHANFVTDTLEDFNTIQIQLNAIQGKLASRTVARTFLTAPNTYAELKEIEMRLAHKEHNIQVLGMLGTVASEMKFTCDKILDRVSNDIEERKRIVNMEPAEVTFMQVCQTHLSKTYPLSSDDKRNEWSWLDDMNPADKFATGVSFYEGNSQFGPNFEKAARFLHAADKAGEREASYYLGMMYLKGQGVSKNNIQAIEFFEKGTGANDPKATLALGECYLFGNGVDANPELGVSYICISSFHGNPKAMSYRSFQKLHGFYTDKNPNLAFQLSKKSVSKGHLVAKGNLGRCYMQGIGIERNTRMALQLWEESVEAGSWGIIPLLGKCYEEGIGIEADFSKAAELYQLGIKRQPSFIRPYYGMCLIRGRGVTQDVKAGWKEIQKSVRADIANGWYMRGECYHYGYGVKVNMAEAVRSYQRATQSKNGVDGQIGAHYALGCIYESEKGVTRNVTKAFEHFLFSADRYHEEAQWKVAVLSESGIGVDQNTARAVVYFRLAANSGNREAQNKACEYYLQGAGVQRNLMQAEQILGPAAENGDCGARRLLRAVRKKWRTRRRQSASMPATT